MRLGEAHAIAAMKKPATSGPLPTDPVANEIRSGGRRALAIHADVSCEDEVDAMFAQAVAELGRLHIVVCNAGLQRDAPFHEMSLEQWNTVIGVNLTGQFLMISVAPPCGWPQTCPTTSPEHRCSSMVA